MSYKKNTEGDVPPVVDLFQESLFFVGDATQVSRIVNCMPSARRHKKKKQKKHNRAFQFYREHDLTHTSVRDNGTNANHWLNGLI